MQKSSRLEADSTLAELLQELPAGLKELAREKPLTCRVSGQVSDGYRARPCPNRSRQDEIFKSGKRLMAFGNSGRDEPSRYVSSESRD